MLDITPEAPPEPDDRWRGGHLGRLMGLALRRFDERVLSLMAHDANVPASRTSDDALARHAILGRLMGLALRAVRRAGAAA